MGLDAATRVAREAAASLLQECDSLARGRDPETGERIESMAIRDRSPFMRTALDAAGLFDAATPEHAIAGLALLATLRQSFAPVVAVAPVARITEGPSGTTASTSEMQATSDSYDGGD